MKIGDIGCRARRVVELAGTSAGPAGRRSALAVIAWWESRRLLYNLVLGLAGAASGAVLIAGALLGSVVGVPITLIADPAIFQALAVMAGLVLANVAYAAGWVCELTLGRDVVRRWPRLPVLAWIAGAAFSAAVVAVPAVVVVAMLVVGVLGRPGRADLPGRWIAWNARGVESVELRPDGTCRETWAEPGEPARRVEGTWSHDGRRVTVSGLEFGGVEAFAPESPVEFQAWRALDGSLVMATDSGAPIELHRVRGHPGDG